MNIRGRFWLAILVLGLSNVQADDIAVIGTGMMGSALGPRLAAAGHTIIYGSRSPASERVLALVAESGPRASAMPQPQAARAGNVIILAVPWKALSLSCAPRPQVRSSSMSLMRSA
jgi:3-hydroxyisobutyrate dehydrogenase-like beta-hydroxyacid dehydrogenase